MRFVSNNAWEPGSYGKGFLDETGTLHTWPVDDETFTPSHSHQAVMRGVQMRKPFVIGPTGEIWYGLSKQFDPVYEQDSRLRPREGSHTAGDWTDAYFKDRHKQQIEAIEQGGAYHAAPSSERARIQQHGLQPGNPNVNPRWEYELAEMDPQPTGLYVTHEPESAKRWGEPYPESMEPHLHDPGEYHGNPMYDVWHIPPSQMQDPPMRDPLVDAWIINHPVRPTLHTPGEHHWKWPHERENLESEEIHDNFYGELPGLVHRKQLGIGLPDRIIGSHKTGTDYSQYADPNCKVCYGQGSFMDADGVDWPCYKCVHGKVPPIADQRPVQKVWDFNPKDMARIPMTDLRSGLQSNGSHNRKSDVPGRYGAQVKVASFVGYHVAPRSARDSILQHGLMGHTWGEQGSMVQPAWNYTWGQPKGNYMYLSPHDAGDYGRMKYRHSEPDDENDGHYDENDQWVENPDYDPIPRSNYDVWKVHATGLPLFPDPETRIVRKDGFGQHGGFDYRNDAGGDEADLGELYKHENPPEDEWVYHDEVPLRIVTPLHVSPQRLSLLPEDHEAYEDRGEDSWHEDEEGPHKGTPRVWDELPVSLKHMVGAVESPWAL